MWPPWPGATRNDRHGCRVPRGTELRREAGGKGRKNGAKVRRLEGQPKLFAFFSGSLWKLGGRRGRNLQHCGRVVASARLHHRSYHISYCTWNFRGIALSPPPRSVKTTCPRSGQDMAAGGFQAESGMGGRLIVWEGSPDVPQIGWWGRGVLRCAGGSSNRPSARLRAAPRVAGGPRPLSHAPRVLRARVVLLCVARRSLARRANASSGRLFGFRVCRCPCVFSRRPGR